MEKRLLLSLLILLAMVAGAHDFEVDGIYYGIYDNNEVYVTFQGLTYDSNYNEYSGDVTIPETVTYGGSTYSVTAIGSQAFCYCRELINVTIPNTVKVIGKNAFASCTNLISINIPNNLTSIKQEAFNGCISLSKVYISDLRAWLNIDFEGDSSDPPSCAANPINRGCLYLNGRLITHLIIPESVSTIKDYTFGGCDGFSCIEIPSSVTSIGKDSFGGCDGITYLKIPDSVTFIGYYAFGWCHTLKDLIIGNSVTNIMKCAFAYSNSLENIVIPNSITSIGTEIFHGCNNISTITIYGKGEWQGAAINHKTKTLYIDSQITSLNGIKINPTIDVYSFSTIPPVCDANSFTNYNGTLHVPASSLASYFQLSIGATLQIS